MRLLLLAGWLLIIAVPTASAQRNRNPALDSLLNENDSIALQQKIGKLAQSDKETDLNLLVQFYNRKNDAGKTEETLATAIRKFPKGEYAFNKAGNAIVEEKEPAKKEKMLLAMKAAFRGRSYDMYYYDVAYSYAGEKGVKVNTDKVIHYARQVADKGFHNEAYLLIAEQLLNNDQPKFAETLVKGTIDSLKISMNTTAAPVSPLTADGRPPRDLKSAYYRCIALYAKILLKENELAKAMPYAKEAYDSSNKKNADINATYLRALMANGSLKEAFPLMEKGYRNGEATAEVKQKLKDAYIAAHGTDKGYDGYFALLQADLLDSAKAKIALFKVNNEKAPSFSLKDIDGKTVSLDSLKGKIVVLDFWATWCGPCKKSFPAMQMAVTKYKNDRDVVFLFIDTWEHTEDPLPAVSAYIKDHDYTFRVLLDAKDPVTKTNKVIESFKVTGIPTKFILNRKGEIVYRLTGFSGGDDGAVEELSAMIEAAKAPTLVIGDPAPVMKVSKWIKGEPVNNFEKGKVYVVEFWATWCLPCIAGMPHLSELAGKYQGKVAVSGISVFERSTTSLARIERFVDSMAGKMDYHVAAEEGSFMADNWLKAAGERGIPQAMVVDREGRIAWIGAPKSLDTVLPKVLEGSWDIAAAAFSRKERQRLTLLDQTPVVLRLNPFMGNPGKPDSALMEIDKILAENPGLKYYPKTGHFTFYSLLQTVPEKALTFGREWIAANTYPEWGTITEAIAYMVEIRKKDLPHELYEFGAECYQAQIDNYPWSMNLPVTYDNIAALRIRAGNKNKAVEAEQKAIENAKTSPGFSQEELKKLEDSLEKYKSAGR